MNYDNILSKIFFQITKSGKQKFNVYKLRKLESYPNIQNYLINKYIDSKDYKEILYRIRYNIDSIPVCPSCGKQIKITYKPLKLYRDFCSTKCSNANEQKINNYINKCLSECGVKYHFLLGKNENTFIKRFGVSHPMQAEEIKKKRINTLKANNTFNKSTKEEQIYNIILSKYPDVVRQYSSELYPFNCDFYIPSLDLYIEYQGSWTHGFKPYEGTDEDNKKLNIWKSKHKKYYDNAIKTWTIRDVTKRKIAKDNNLKYIELWDISDINNIL